MLVNPSRAEPTECIYPRAAVATLPGQGLKISQPLRGCRVLRLSEHGRATPSDTIYCIYLCTSPEGVELFIAPVCVSAASTDWGRQCNNEAAPKGLTSISDAHNHRGPHDCPHHASIVVAAPCAGQQGTCIQQPEDVFLQALVHKDVGRHKARPLQLLIIAIE